jgi:hypothetical protein
MTNTVSTEQRTTPRNAEHRSSVDGKATTVPSLRFPYFRLGALIAVGFAAFIVSWVAMSRGDDTPSVPGSGASAASESELKALADSVSHPVYWAGPMKGYTYELTRTTNGLVYVRYLPEGTGVGDPRSQFLTVGTYPRAGAYAELQRAAKAKGAVSLKVGDDGLAVFSQSRPTSVYLGYPDAKYQVEVFNPSPDEARRLALSGQIVPVR